MNRATAINHVIFYIPLLPSGNLLLVERNDGRVYIVQNDVLLTEQSWIKAEAPQALTAFKKCLELLTPKCFPQ